MTEEALLDRSRRWRCPFDAEAGCSVGSAGCCDCCCAGALSDTGDMASGGGGSMLATSMKSSMEAVLAFPFSRNEEVGAERPRIWGAAVESAESVERERLTSRRESEEMCAGRPLWARREAAGGGAVMVVVVEVVVDVGLDEDDDDDSRFLFTMLGRRSCRGRRQPIARGGRRTHGEARGCDRPGGGRACWGDEMRWACEKVCAAAKWL